MIKFDYKLNYKQLDFTKQDIRKLYRIGRGEQGVLLVRPYTNDICKHWRFKTPDIATQSANKIYDMYCDYKLNNDFVDICVESFQKWFTRQEDTPIIKMVESMIVMQSITTRERRLIYGQEKSARIFKVIRDRVCNDLTYVKMRKK